LTGSKTRNPPLFEPCPWEAGILAAGGLEDKRFRRVFVFLFGVNKRLSDL
jgi:hypothetical protein